MNKQRAGGEGSFYWETGFEGVGSFLPLAGLLSMQRIHWQKAPETLMASHFGAGGVESWLAPASVVPQICRQPALRS
jgi:hypothetical protein